MPETRLPYKILDADNHFNEPRNCFDGYIDPSKKDLAIRWVTDDQGRDVQLFAGKPSRFSVEQITFSREELESMLGDVPDTDDGTPASGVVPGMLLNRLNPLKGLSDEERIELVAELRNQHEACGSRDLRLALMDEQGIEAALMFPAQAHAIEHEFVDNMEALYANIRAFNRWMYEEVGFAAENRMFLPPYVPLADPELAVEELEILLEQGAPIIQIKAGHAHGGRDNPFGGRSPADPGVRPHLVTRQRGGRAARGSPGRYRLPEVRRRLVRGPRPTRSGPSTRSSTSCTGRTAPRWSSSPA